MMTFRDAYLSHADVRVNGARDSGWRRNYLPVAQNLRNLEAKRFTLRFRRKAIID